MATPNGSGSERSPHDGARKDHDAGGDVSDGAPVYEVEAEEDETVPIPKRVAPPRPPHLPSTPPS